MLESWKIGGESSSFLDRGLFVSMIRGLMRKFVFEVATEIVPVSVAIGRLTKAGARTAGIRSRTTIRAEKS